MKVNGWTWRQAYAYVQAAFALWERRNEDPWELDIRWLKLTGC